MHIGREQSQVRVGAAIERQLDDLFGIDDLSMVCVGLYPSNGVGLRGLP